MYFRDSAPNIASSTNGANTMVLVTRTYSEVTPESAEDGDFSDSGTICEDVPYTFKELVSLLEDHPDASSVPASGGTQEWYSTGYLIEDYSTGTEREECVHYSRNNKPHNARYWRLAAIAAGIVKA